MEALRLGTGQTAFTINYFDPTFNLNAPRIAHTRTVHVPGIRWASRYYNYPVCQLQDLSPLNPATQNAPFFGEPPPNLLNGYFYLARVLNDYLFDQRTFSNISYRIDYSMSTSRRRMRWIILTDCSYEIDVSPYMRLFDGRDPEDFGQTLTQMQNAVLMDRVYATLHLQPITGFGAAVELQNQQRAAAPRFLGFGQAYRTLRVSRRDLCLLRSISNTRKALLNFILLTNRPSAAPQINLPCQPEWLTRFVEIFSSRPTPEIKTTREVSEVASCMTLGRAGMRGGALTLRSGRRIGLPVVLRPRERGRAVTESLRRQRGETIRQFIDLLPVRTRRVTPRATPTASAPSESEEPVEEEEERGSDYEESSPSRSPPEEEPQAVNEEIVETLGALIQALEEELTPGARDSQFFNFGAEFFALLIRTNNNNVLSERLLRRWVLNFFIMEHLASTLYYLSARLFEQPGRRLVHVQFAQIILRGRDEQGENLFSRVWSSANEENPFLRLYQRIKTDFLVITETDRDLAFQTPEEREQLLADMQYVENSGNIEEILRQVQVNDLNLASVDIAVRVKASGLVAFSQNRRIQSRFETNRASAVRQWLSRPGSFPVPFSSNERPTTSSAN